MSALTWLMVACLVSIMVLVRKLAELDNERQDRERNEW